MQNKKKKVVAENIEHVYALVVYVVKLNGWCNGFVFCGNRNFSMQNLSVRKSEKCVHLDFDVVFETKKTRICKEVRARYDLNNYHKIKRDVERFYRQLEGQTVFIGDKVYLNEFNALKLEEKGWFRQF